MRRFLLRCAVLVGVSLVATSPGWGVTAVVVSRLKAQAAPPAPFFQATGKSVNVRVVDARADKSFIAAALIGPDAEEDDGVFMGYGTPTDDDLAAFVSKAANSALPVLGFAPGSDLTLSLTIREFRVDMYRVSAFSPMNCMGYGIVEARLSSTDGAELKNETLHLAYYENTTPVSVMDEVAEGALSRIYSQMAWEAAATVLLDIQSPEPDATAIESFAKSAGSATPAAESRDKIFWLGIAGQPLPAVNEALMAMFRSKGKQKIYQGAVEALGKLGVNDVRETIEGILAGTQDVGDWDNADDEHVWYLLRALAALGEKDLASKVPKTKLRMPSKIRDLIAFENAGTVPPLSAAGVAQLDTAKKKLEKKRKEPRW